MNFFTNHKQKIYLFETGGQPIYSDEVIVISRLLQGTVLGTTLFLIYINNISNYNNMDLSADDAKLFGIAKPHKIQYNLDRLQNWSQGWLLQFNTRKCCILQLGPNSYIATYSILNPIANITDHLVKREE